jgi:hypothetical protein
MRFDAAGNGNPDMVELMRHSQRKRRAPARLDLRPRRHFLPQQAKNHDCHPWDRETMQPVVQCFFPAGCLGRE